MIGLLVALGLLGADPEPVNPPFHFSGFIGGESDLGKSDRSWLEIDAQAEFGTIAFLRGAYAQPVSGTGSGERDLAQEMRTLCLGTEWRQDWLWVATGAGWTWRRLDTNTTYIDPRQIFVEDQNGLHSVDGSSPVYGRSRQIGWQWPQRVEDKGPYLMGEVGAGWQTVSVCIRSEYRFCPALGIFLRARIP